MINKNKIRLLRMTSLGFLLMGALGVLIIVAISPGHLARISEPKTPDVRVFQSEAKKKTSSPSGSADNSSKPSPLPDPVVNSAQNDSKSKEPAKSADIEKKYYVMAAPNDTYNGSQWYLNTVKAHDAWNITTGSSSVKVAVIDSGFALNHLDLAPSWLINSGEMGGGKELDGVDNDGNGYVDDYRGWDFTTNDNNPQAGSTNPDGEGASHGTEVAGLVGARGNNGIGVTAVSQTVSILPLQVISDEGVGYSTDIAKAIRYAVDSGVTAINISLGTDGDDPIVRSAVDYAFEHNVIIVAAAGNCGNDFIGICSGQVAGFVAFPASYNRVIAVGATNSANQRASFSSYGERLDVMAPGSGTIISPTWSASNGSSLYAGSLYGTSYASPIVASTAALIRSVRPSSTVDDIRALLMAGASKPPAMNGSFYSNEYGHGIIDAAKAVSVASDLGVSGEQVPALLQTGSSQSEHGFNLSEQMSSGCGGQANTWCTAWLKSTESNNERYLPYTRTGSDGLAGWSWPGLVLNRGEWQVRARQGSLTSNTPYVLFRK